MNLMPDEKILLESDPKGLILTTHRIRSEDEGLGNAQIKSIMLEELASCAIVQTSNNVLLILAALCVLIGLLLTAGGRGDAAPFILSLLIAGILIAAYFSSRQQVLALASAGTTIRTNTKGMKLQAVKQFIDRVEVAKNERYLLVKRM
jgi:hypothetical protein